MSEYVYYLRLGGRIKIGYSAHLANRMRALRPDELLAVEPGNLMLEAGRHHQFRAHHIETPDGREWFEPAPELIEHIATMASIYPLPTLADLLPSQSRAPRQPRVEDRPPLDPAGFEALGRVLDVDMDDLESIPTDELLDRLRDVFAVERNARTWTGRFVTQLRDNGSTLTQLVELTALPQTTLGNRERRYLQSAPTEPLEVSA